MPTTETPAFLSATKPPQLLDPKDAAKRMASDVHAMGKGKKILCKTDDRGYATPQNRGPADLVLNKDEGYIRLWAPGTILRWRFEERSMKVWADPGAAKDYIRKLLSDALLLWGDGLLIGFNETIDRRIGWDFEIAMVPEDCSPNGCVLASAFFPDGGRHQLELYPTMFSGSQSQTERVETLAHELGHVLGLRHFFADVSETAWPVEIFGKHSKFSIMNYGEDSRMTDDDKADLKRLYESAWNGTLTEINGTPISLEQPYSVLHPRALPRPPRLLGDELAAYARAAPR